MLSARSLGIPEVSNFVKVIHVDEDGVARGGVADVYPGLFQQDGIPTIKVAIKTVRIPPHKPDSALGLQKSQRKLNRELGIWRILQGDFGHPNVLNLLGVIDSPDGMPSSVSEFCVATLAEYLVNPIYKPHRVELLVGILNGLAYMHGFSIVHGDLKGLNILVDQNGTPKICDFGHSRFINDSAQPTVSDLSSKFHSTTRYMSPELFLEPKSRPTLFSDIWAFGCVALEILSQLRPYHVITNEHRVTVAIKSGRIPSTKPGYPYAASCLTDTLWSIIKGCWHPRQLSRPTSASLSQAINDLIEKGQLNTATSTPLQVTKSLGEELFDWPEDIQDFAATLSKLKKVKISMQRMADVWRYFSDAHPTSSSSQTSQMYVVKVLRAPAGLGSNSQAIDPLQQGLRRAVWERLGVKHQHIIELLGIDTSYGRYPGLVMEFHQGGNLRNACYVLATAPLSDEHFPVRCMIQILKGLQFLHKLPSPLAHGDLTPHNIIADRNGTLKITLISFARLSANLPSNTQTVAPNDDAISVRYLSPELISNDDGSWPTPPADMWSFGCVACWMYVRIDPYPECRLEHEIVSSIIAALPPYLISQLSHMAQLGGRHVMPDAPWITNGTMAAILRCWNQDASQRPTATSCLNDFSALLESADRKKPPVSPDVQDLTGKIKTPDHPKKTIIGHCWGNWRRIFNYKGDEPIELCYWWWRGVYSPGILRRSIQVNIKGVKLGPRVRSGDLLDSARQGIYHEIGLLRQLKHENICAFYGYDDTHGGTIIRLQAPAILTEFCPNGTLSEYCSTKANDLSYQDRLNLVRDVARAISYIHIDVPDGSVVHGNLSMDTVRVDQNGKAKLTGFEFACQYEHSDSLMLARVIYTPHIAPTPSRWHPPELFNDSTDAELPYPTKYMDLWALGCLLIAVLSNQAPYEKYDLPGATSCIIEGEKPYSQDVCAVKVWELANSLWAGIPHQRASAEMVLRELSQF